MSLNDIFSLFLYILAINNSFMDVVIYRYLGKDEFFRLQLVCSRTCVGKPRQRTHKGNCQQCLKVALCLELAYPFKNSWIST